MVGLFLGLVSVLTLVHTNLTFNPIPKVSAVYHLLDGPVLNFLPSDFSLGNHNTVVNLTLTPIFKPIVRYFCIVDANNISDA